GRRQPLLSLRRGSCAVARSASLSFSASLYRRATNARGPYKFPYKLCLLYVCTSKKHSLYVLADISDWRPLAFSYAESIASSSLTGVRQRRAGRVSASSAEHREPRAAESVSTWCWPAPPGRENAEQSPPGAAIFYFFLFIFHKYKKQCGEMWCLWCNALTPRYRPRELHHILKKNVVHKKKCGAKMWCKNVVQSPGAGQALVSTRRP
ncbi:hypothetical protein Krac_0048, partial [Ktedonobacter racemifer DSM 44963]